MQVGARKKKEWTVEEERGHAAIESRAQTRKKKKRQAKDLTVQPLSRQQPQRQKTKQVKKDDCVGSRNQPCHVRNLIKTKSKQSRSEIKTNIDLESVSDCTSRLGKGETEAQNTAQ